MGLRIIEDRDGDGAVLVDGDMAFGPVFEDREECELFIEWYGASFRWLNNYELKDRLYKFRLERAQWEAEKAAAEAEEE